MTSAKLIAVMGATGNQGGAVIKALQGNEDFEIRAITRDPSGDKAIAIEPLVKEVVKADADDEDSMVEAFKGCYGAFIVSNFWADMDVEHEMQVLRNCKNAAKTSGLKHVVLSTLEDTRPIINLAENKDTWKKLNEMDMYVPHFDGKGEADQEYDDIPTTKLLTAFYYENYITFGMGPSRGNDSDPYAITFPMSDKKLSMVAISDIGKAVAAIFQDDTLIGKTVGIDSTVLTCKEIADVFAKVCGQPVQYNDVPVEVYASFGFPGADDLANMFRYYAEFNDTFVKNRDLGGLKEKIEVTDFEKWVEENKEAFGVKA